MENTQIAEIVSENRRRLALALDEYDPVRGIGCHGERVEVDTPVDGLPRAFVPRLMVDDPSYGVANDPHAWRMLRCRHDFEYWCFTCVKVKPKLSHLTAPFTLNRAQRKVLKVLEADRLAGRPIRVIILKARQWGCSTLIQSYMAWIQMCIMTNWSSLICCQNKDSAYNIRRMYTNLIANYPSEMWDGGEDGSAKLQLRPFEGSTNIREITGRGCRVAVSSSENQDSMRGFDFAMAHLSETAYWRDTSRHSPDDLIRNVLGSVAMIPYSLVAMESTANGIGNFFYEEWQRAKAGLSDKTPVFVAWYEIEHNSLGLKVSPEEFAATLSDAELKLWGLGCTLEQICWYREKGRGYNRAEQLCSEYPSDDVEAFGSTNAGVFATADVDRMHTSCREPMRTCHVVGERLVDSPGSEFQIWSEPVDGADYVVAVDIGGRSLGSDWSVIAVMRRGDDSTDGRHEIVAQWRGHVDHDILVDIARVIAARYNEALLVIESNTLESEPKAAAGANGFILDRLAAVYHNLYRRYGSDGEQGGVERIGFHTNRVTKAKIINNLIEAVREGYFIERCADACYEFAVYTQLANGSYGAKRGYHDDMLMTRAFAITALAETPPPVTVPPLTAINLSAW